MERGAIAEEKTRKEIESENKLRALRDQEMADREAIEKEAEVRRKEEDKRKRRGI